MKKAHHHFIERKITQSHVFFSLSNSPKLKDIQLIVM